MCKGDSKSFAKECGENWVERGELRKTRQNCRTGRTEENWGEMWKGGGGEGLMGDGGEVGSWGRGDVWNAKGGEKGSASFQSHPNTHPTSCHHKQLRPTSIIPATSTTTTIPPPTFHNTQSPSSRPNTPAPTEETQEMCTRTPPPPPEHLRLHRKDLGYLAFCLSVVLRFFNFAKIEPR